MKKYFYSLVATMITKKMNSKQITLEIKKVENSIPGLKILSGFK